MTPGRPSLADECEAILSAIGDEAVTLDFIAEDTGLPRARIVDLIHGPLANQIQGKPLRMYGGVKTSLFSRMGERP